LNGSQLRHTGDTLIRTYSLRRVGKELKQDPRVVKGAALALGIKLEKVATSWAMSGEDFEQIRDKLGRPEPVAAAAG
jgi:hypothetical protein